MTPLQSLAEYGQSAWIDAPMRELIRTGRLEHLMREHGISGAVSCESVSERVVCQACDLLLPTWQLTGGRDGYVSLDIEHLRLRHGRPNVLVEIPATVEGLRAVEDSIAAGASVNVTRIYSPARHRDAVAAYLRGLERLLERGGDPAAVTSVASVFISPVDIEVDRHLEAIGGAAPALRGRLAIANARLAYQQYKDAFGGPRWRELETRGARPQRCLWASTSPQPGAYADVLYLEELIGADTITALTPAAIEAFEDHGLVADRLGRRTEEARRIVDDVRTAGVDLDDVWRTLEAGERALRRPCSGSRSA